MLFFVSNDSIFIMNILPAKGRNGEIMTNRRRFFINGLLLSAVGIAVRSAALLFNSFITHTVGAEGVGLFTLIGSIYGFAVTFATSGISLTVTRLVSSKIGEGTENGAVGVLRSSIVYALIFSSFATAVLFFGAEYFGLSVLSDIRTVRPLRILSLSLIPIALSSVFSGYFVGVKRVPMNAAAQVASQIFKICLTVALLEAFGGRSIESGCIALSLGATITESAVFVIALVEYLIDKKRHFDKIKGSPAFSDVTKTALPLAASAYIRQALLSLEHIIIPKKLRERGEDTGTALSHYGTLHGMALPMLLYPMAPLSSFAGLLVPEFSESDARGEHSRIARIASEALDSTLTYAIAASVLMLVFSEPLGNAVYGSADAGKYIAVMAPVIPIMYLDHVADSMLKGIGEQVYSMWINITDSIISIVLVWVLIPKLGILGYGVVIVVMEGYNFALSVIKLRGRVKFKINFMSALIIPTVAALSASYLVKLLFLPLGRFTPRIWLVLELLFSVCIFLAVYKSLTLLYGMRSRREPADS